MYQRYTELTKIMPIHKLLIHRGADTPQGRKDTTIILLSTVLLRLCSKFNQVLYIFGLICQKPVKFKEYSDCHFTK